MEKVEELEQQSFRKAATVERSEGGDKWGLPLRLTLHGEQGVGVEEEWGQWILVR